jgi:hypothetical protein
MMFDAWFMMQSSLHHSSYPLLSSRQLDGNETPPLSEPPQMRRNTQTFLARNSDTYMCVNSPKKTHQLQGMKGKHERERPKKQHGNEPDQKSVSRKSQKAPGRESAIQLPMANRVNLKLLQAINEYSLMASWT